MKINSKSRPFSCKDLNVSWVPVALEFWMRLIIPILEIKSSESKFIAVKYSAWNTIKDKSQ